MSESTKDIVARLAAEAKEAQIKEEEESAASTEKVEAEEQQAITAEDKCKVILGLTIAPLKKAIETFNNAKIARAHAQLLNRINSTQVTGNDTFKADFYGEAAEFTWQAGFKIEFYIGKKLDLWYIGFTTLHTGDPKQLRIATCYTRHSTGVYNVNDSVDPMSKGSTEFRTAWAERQIDAMLSRVSIK